MGWFEKFKESVSIVHIKDKNSKTANADKSAGLKRVPSESVMVSSRRNTDMDDVWKRKAVSNLAPREREVFVRCLEGTKMRDIADELNMKTSTVNGYCREVYRKLGVNSKVQLVLQYSEFKSYINS